MSRQYRYCAPRVYAAAAGGQDDRVLVTVPSPPVHVSRAPVCAGEPSHRLDAGAIADGTSAQLEGTGDATVTFQRHAESAVVVRLAPPGVLALSTRGEWAVTPQP